MFKPSPYARPVLLVITGLLIAFLVFVFVRSLPGCGKADVETVDGGNVIEATPPRPILQEPETADGEPAVIVSDEEGNLTVIPDPTRPDDQPPPLAVITIPARPGAPGSGGVPGTPGYEEGEPLHVAIDRVRLLFPEFRRRSEISARVIGMSPGDTLSSPLILTHQVPPLIDPGLSLSFGVDHALSGSSGASGAALYVAASPLRVWGFRPDLGLSIAVAPDSALSGLTERATVSAGVSARPLTNVSLRLSQGLTGADAGMLRVGIGIGL